MLVGAWFVDFSAQRRKWADLRFLTVMLIVVAVHGGSYLLFYRFTNITPASESPSNVLAWLFVVVAFWAAALFLATARRYWPAFLCAGLWFVVAGEEISWGQWVFGWSTPSLFEGNFQKETNFHNYIDPIDPMEHYFYVFVFTVGWLSFTRRAQTVCRYLPRKIAGDVRSLQQLARSKFLDLLALWMLVATVIPLPGIFSSYEYVEQLFALFGLALAMTLYAQFVPTTERRRSEASLWSKSSEPDTTISHGPPPMASR